MNSTVRAARILVALGVTLLIVACGPGATVSPSPAATNPTPSPTVATVTSSPVAGTPTPIPTPSPTLAATPTATSQAGQMTRGRSSATATRLEDGRVLVAGGYYNGRAIASADRYDPTTNAFAETGPLAAARAFDTATPLEDGRVLVVGGTPFTWTFGGPFLDSAELYDPQTDRFSPTGALATARNEHAATLLADGRVLITGGNDAFGRSVASAELYDPQTGKFSPAGSMKTARGFHTATRLADGRVLIAAGSSDGWSGTFLASAELYDPTTDTFTETGSMADARASHTATLLADGRVLITGGVYGSHVGSTSRDSAELYDPETGTFSPADSMADARTFHTASRLLDDRVLVTGGTRNGWDYTDFLASAEIYDPTTGTVSATGSMVDTLLSHTATLLTDGRVLIAGGANGSIDVAAGELFDPSTGTFSPTGPGG